MELEIGEVLTHILVIIVFAKLGGEVMERIGQPPVLGELLAGILIGPSILGIIKDSAIITVLAEIGVILLLFEVGLETDIADLLRLGKTSLLVAAIGVFLPFVFGYSVVKVMGIGGEMMAIFMGATLTATSVGITARVYSDLKKLKTDEAKIVLGAAVMDDVIGLIILAIVLTLIDTGKVSFENVAKTSFIALSFLALAIVIGLKVVAPIFESIVSRYKNEEEEEKGKFNEIVVVTSFAFCMVVAILADLIGLATIVGAFAAGVILAQTHHEKEIKYEIFPLAKIFVPVFFVLMGILVDVKTFFSKDVLLLALIITVLAILGKVVSGFGAYGKNVKKIPIGVGMIPRGEVGLIFASFGIVKGVISSSIYSSIIFMVVVTTFITPPLLKKTMAGIRQKGRLKVEVPQELH